jgi:hypothetical protein
VTICVVASQAPAAANVAPHDEKQIESNAFSCFFYKNGDVGCAKSEGGLSNVDFSQVDEEIPAKSIEALLSELDKALAEEGGWRCSSRWLISSPRIRRRPATAASMASTSKDPPCRGEPIRGRPFLGLRNSFGALPL